MGMYTVAEEPGTGLKFQFKTGQDDLVVYKIGDKIPWSAYLNPPDIGIDRIYEAWGDAECPGPHRWVVVVDSILVAILPIKESWEEIASRYAFVKPDPGLWSQEVRDRYRKIQEELDLETSIFEESIKDLPEDQQRKARWSRLVSRRINYSSFARLMLPVDDLPSQASDFYGSKPENRDS